MAELPTENRRRLVLRVAVKTMGALALLATALMLLKSLPGSEPSARGGVAIISVADLAAGEVRLLQWQGKSVLILRRSDTMVAQLAAEEGRLLDPHSVRSTQPVAARNRARSLQPHYFVALAYGTDMGCPLEWLPEDRAPRGFRGWNGGFRETCGGSLYDPAGRVYRGQGAKRNLIVPPHRYISADQIEIGIQ